MKLHDLFKKTDAYWVKYNEYEYREHDGEIFVAPVAKAKPSVYDPLKVADALVVDALNVGMLLMNKKPEREVKAAILDFTTKYGLLGFMTALPTTPEFVDYDAVYLPKNPVIRAETMDVNDFVDLFFPFEKLDFKQRKGESIWNIGGDREMMALAMTFGNNPTAQNLSFQRGYSERYDWLRGQFRDWAFSFCASIFYYEETDETLRDLHRQAMSAFGGIAPHYRVALYDDKPQLVWDFHSLLQTVQMVFSFALTDEQKPLRSCRHCTKVFLAQDARATFCSHECKNRHNVYKSRGKKKGT